MKMSKFSRKIMLAKYAHPGEKTWEEIAERAVREVMSAVKIDEAIVDKAVKMHQKMKFVLGGRYLYAAGLPVHQTQNCLAMIAEDSREGWRVLV